MAKKPKWLSPDEPLRHPDHPRPVTRREFIRQGFIGGSAMVTGGSALLNLMLAQNANAALSQDISDLATASGCPVGFNGNGKIPFICFDLAGGANLAGSNVLVGGQNGPLVDPLSTAGYSKLGIPADRVPLPGSQFVDESLGLAFHSESAMLAGILSAFDTATFGSNINGFVIPARSNNDTNNNPHNPMYGIAHAGQVPPSPVDPMHPGVGAKGSLLSLIGSVASDSGGNSMAPAGLIDLTIRPTKISRPTDATSLVDTGDLATLLGSQADTISVMEASARISNAQFARLGLDPKLQKLLNCGYLGAADNVDKIGSKDDLDPTKDPLIAQVFQRVGLSVSSDSEFLKAASVMKLVVNGFAGAGTVTMGGFDYHTGDRITGELRDVRAGRCIGACLQYAALLGKPLMVYVFSDGSLFSNGTPDSNANITTKDGLISLPPGKGVWTGDNSTTACTFALIYNPSGNFSPVRGNNQIGYFRATGDVETSARTPTNNPIVAANNVTELVNTLLLNYMALHGEQPFFTQAFPNANLGGTPIDELIVFDKIVNGTIDKPV